MSDCLWKLVDLQDITQTSITYGVVKPGVDDPDGVLFIRGGDITGNEILINQLRGIKKELSEQYKRTILQGGEILVSLVGTIGQVALVPKSLAGANIYRQIAMVRLKRDFDARFIRYFLLSPFGQQEIFSHQQGTVQSVINLKELKQIKVPSPSLEEQKRIADVLFCLDRKISNLRQQNETLEKIAQTLFKHWFVDFEFPNEDGKPYKSSGGEMVRSESGEIPAGWSIGTSGDLIYLQGGFAFKSQDFKDFGNHRILKIKNISGNVVDIQQTDFIADSTAKRVDSKFKVKSGDVLIAMTGAEVAKMGLVPTTNEAIWLNQRVGLFREVIPGARVFIYCLFTRESHQQLLRDRGSGSSAQPNISGNDIESIPLVKPIQSVLAIFAEVVEPLIRKKCDNLQQIQTLTKTRDVLLPKLMSGKLRITAS